MQTKEYFNNISDNGVEYFEMGCLCYLSGKIPKGKTYEYRTYALY